MVYVFLGNGFEEMEALAPIDLLRRADIEVMSVSLYKTKEVIGGHGVPFTADTTIFDLPADLPDMVVLPGGLGGVDEISRSEQALLLIDKMMQENRFVAAICAAPTLLSDRGLLRGKKATCYPAMRDRLGASAVPCPLCADGKILTAEAAGTAIDFALLLIKALVGKETADRVAASIHHHAL